MGVAELIGGLPSLTAVLVILTGILGAIGFPGMTECRLDDGCRVPNKESKWSPILSVSLKEKAVSHT